MTDWERVATIADELALRGRPKVRGEAPNSEWQPIWLPAPGYVETGRLGPMSVREIEWIDLETRVRVHRGRLLPPVVEDKSAALSALLAKVAVQVEQHDGWLRVLPF